MASLNSWLSPDVMHALGWALIHSLWQCLGVAALAAVLMAFSRRPSIRYLAATTALVLMLAAPVATFFVLMNQVSPVHVPANGGASISSTDRDYPASAIPIIAALPVAAPSRDVSDRVVDAFATSPNLLPWLVVGWLCGVAFFSLRFAGGFLLLEHKRRSQSVLLHASILALCQDVQRQLGLGRTIRFLECAWLQTPAVIGWLRPILLLPVSVLMGLSEEQLRAVIAHELAHVRRLDAFVNLFQILVETLLFYHPVVWWLNRRIRAERELCCDEIAVSLTGNRVEYARALTLMAEWETAPILAMAANRGPLSARILHILGRKSVGAGQRLLGLTGGILFLAAALTAANTLFVIAYPVPAAHAKESIRAALSSAQSAGDRAVHQALRAIAPAAQIAAPSKVPTSRETVAPGQIGAIANSQAETLVPPSPDLSGLLPKQNIATPTLVASLDARPPALNDQTAAPVLLPVDPDAPPLKGTSHDRRFIQLCSRNNNVTGRVISPQAIHLRIGFQCMRYEEPGSVAFGFGICPCKGVNMNVELANPADTEKMQTGRRVTVFGNFQYATIDHVNYLIVKNARVKADPFDRAVQSDEPASNAMPAAPQGQAAQSGPVPLNSPQSQDGSGETIGLNSKPIATHAASVNNPDAATVDHCRNSSVFGAVLSPKAILMQGFACVLEAPKNGSSGEARDIRLGSCPLASTTSAKRLDCKWDVAMNVELADPADAGKMQPGKLVRLGGDFHITRRGQTDYLTVQNARVLFTDLFWFGGPTFRKAPPGAADMPTFYNGGAGGYYGGGGQPAP